MLDEYTLIIIRRRRRHLLTISYIEPCNVPVFLHATFFLYSFSLSSLSYSLSLVFVLLLISKTQVAQYTITAPSMVRQVSHNLAITYSLLRKEV